MRRPGTCGSRKILAKRLKMGKTTDFRQVFHGTKTKNCLVCAVPFPIAITFLVHHLFLVLNICIWRLVLIVSITNSFTLHQIFFQKAINLRNGSRQKVWVLKKSKHFYSKMHGVCGISIETPRSFVHFFKISIQWENRKFLANFCQIWPFWNQILQ